jgi:hypothetical protein
MSLLRCTLFTNTNWRVASAFRTDLDRGMVHWLTGVYMSTTVIFARRIRARWIAAFAAIGLVVAGTTGVLLSSAAGAATGPAIKVVQSSTTTGITDVGQVVPYSFLVTNTGNVTIADVTIAEGAFSGSGTLSTPVCPAAAASLAPAASVTCTVDYTVTAVDLSAGSTLTNTATAKGTPPGSSTVVTSDPSTAKVLTPAPAAATLPVTGVAAQSQIAAGLAVLLIGICLLMLAGWRRKA